VGQLISTKPVSFGNGIVQGFLNIKDIDTLGFGFSIIFDCNFLEKSSFKYQDLQY
jgi:hypothetical protein